MTVVDVTDCRFTVEIDEEPLMDGVEYLREEVMRRRHSCPECGYSVSIEIVTKASRTDEDRRLVVLAASCEDGTCEWEHRLLAGGGLTLSGPSPGGDA